jgi:hypothetical protein
MTAPASLADARARVMERCARRGHDWTPDDHGMHCTRCPMTITTNPERKP